MKGGPYRWVQPEHRAWRSQPIVGAPRRNSVPILCGLWFVAGAGMATIVAVLVG